MMPIQDFFERVYVINLRRRPDRLRAFFSRLNCCDWPFYGPEVYPAVEGDKVGVPPEFTQGGGAFGCRESHLRILQDCLMENVSSVLVLEDDADLPLDFGARVRAFLPQVPEDWQGIMLGGQHHAPPIPVSDGVVRVRYAQRTHAYAARKPYMRALQRRWGCATVHIDWRMRDWQHLQTVYAPDPWLIGQAGGRSDIRGDEKPAEWWTGSGHETAGPVAVAFVSRDALETMRVAGFHPGMSCNDADGIDAGLAKCFSTKKRSPIIRSLRHWLEMIQAECVGGLLPTVWHPRATAELVSQAWDGPVYEVRGETADEAMASLPADVRERMQARVSLRASPVVFLRCPRPMVEELHAAGFHPGYWRDRATGIDNGLQQLFGGPEADRPDRLRKWCDYLLREADRDGMVVVARHPDLTAEMVRGATNRDVIEIEAQNVGQLKAAFFEAHR